MVKVSLLPGEVSMGGYVAVQRHVRHMFTSQRHRWGHPGKVQGWQLEIEGALAELAVAKALRTFWSGALGRAAMHTGDVAGYEVRYTRGSAGCLLTHEDDHDDRPYILVTGDEPDFVVRGWLWGRETKRPEWWRDPQGTSRWAFFVPQSALRPMDTLPPMEHGECRQLT